MTSATKFSAAALFLSIGAVAQAATLTWTNGAGDWEYANGANWSGDRAPYSTNYSDVAVFSANPGTVRLGRTRTPWSATVEAPELGGLTFETAGWTLSDAPNSVDFAEVAGVSSSGVGLNTISAAIQTTTSVGNWTLASGNTLLVTQALYVKGANLNLSGGGTLQLSTSITGYSSTSWGIHISDGLLKMDTGTPFGPSVGGKIYIDDTDARYQLKTTVAAAQSLIGSRVMGGTGITLGVSDIGGGYVEILSIPEPATMALIGAVGLGALARRRRLVGNGGTSMRQSVG